MTPNSCLSFPSSDLATMNAASTFKSGASWPLQIPAHSSSTSLTASEPWNNQGLANTSDHHAMRHLPMLLTIILATSGCADRSTHSSVVLDPTQGRAILDQQRPTPNNVEDFWLVSAKTARDIDKNIAQIGQLHTMDGKSAKDPTNTLRQYVGIIVDGKRLVYINAFPKLMGVPHWRTEAIQTADGGTLIWGAVYDPSTQRFDSLSTNACFGSCE